MTLAQFLGLFHPITETKKGWEVCCPAHDDQHPSLGVMEGEGGRIVLNCFAGCQPRHICEALGLSLADLFADQPLNGHAELHRPFVKSVQPRRRAFAFDLHALDLRLAAAKILHAAANCADCETWTDADRELAMKAVSRAYAYLERAGFCEDYADHVREQDYELKRLALG